jgi:energy-coupling factor transport system ATP-binding protein
LSQGEKRRLSVATQLVAGQRLLVLDEPTFGQDQATAAALMERIVGLQRAGTTIIVVTHDMQLVASHATRVAVLAEGRLRYLGPPSGLRDETAVLETAQLELPPIWAIANRLAAVRNRSVNGCITAPITS